MGPIVSWLLFIVGTALAFSWAISSIGPFGLAGATAALTIVARLADGPDRSAIVRRLALAVVIGVHVCWLATLTVLAAVLAWSVSAWVWTLAAVSLALFVATHLLTMRIRVPLALPLGILIAALAYGWMREDGVIRCDDYLRVLSEGLEVAVPSTPDIASCTAGDALTVTRYPRSMWEDPNGGRFLISTQRGDHVYSPPIPAGRQVGAWLDGAICEVTTSGDAPRCFGRGKADAFVDSAARDRLYTTAHDAANTTLYALSRSGSMRVLAEKQVPLRAGILYLDDQSDVVGLCEDEGTQIHHFRASDFTELGAVAAPFTSTYVRYDDALREGVACGAGRGAGGAFSAAAFHGDPFSYRLLAPTSQHPSSWLAVTWGCDWDPAARRVYVAVASLGMLQVIDYDTGRIVSSRFVGPGIRPVAFDGQRRLIYVGTFLSGEVLALDADSLAVAHRWFVGRFLRQLEISRDRRSLLATSTLGIVRVPLAPAAGRAAAANASFAG